MSAAGLFLCSTCGCGEGCSNSTGCTGEYVLTSCTGYRFTLPTFTNVSGTVTADSDAADRFTDFPTTFFYLTNWTGHGKYLQYARKYDGTCDFALSFTLTEPDATAFASPVDSTATGFYRRYNVNGSTYSFDGTSGLGVAKTFTATRVSLTGSSTVTTLPTWADLSTDLLAFGPLTDTISGQASTFTDNGLKYEKEEATLTVSRAGTGTAFAYSLAVAFIYNSYRWTRRETTFDYIDSRTANYTVLEKCGFSQEYVAGGGGGYASISPFADGVNGADTVLTCDGTEKTFDVDYEIARYPADASASLVTGTAGTASMQLAATFTEAEIGCRDCPRVLDLTGTISHQIAPDYTHPGWLTPGDDGSWDYENYEDGPTLGGGQVVVDLAIAARIVTNAVDECQVQYACTWGTSVSFADTFATITPPSGSGDPYDVTLSLTRLGPSLWRLSGATEDPIYLTFSGDCPTGTPTVCQSLNPHSGTPSGSGMSRDAKTFYYLTDPGTPANDGYYDSGGPIAGPYTMSDVSDPTPVVLNSNYDNWITEHTFTFSKGDCEETDPTYFCDACAGPSSVLLDVQCDGVGTRPGIFAEAITLTRSVCNGTCKYEGTIDEFTATITYDADTGEWYAKVLHTPTNTVAVDSHLIGADNDPTGDYGFESTDPVDGDPSWDEECSDLRIIVT